MLLIACANVSHMLLARAAARREEIALRTALGAGRWDMFCQLLTESLVLASMGGSAGLLLAVWGVRALVALGPADIPRVETIGVDGHVLLFAVGISLLTGLAFGMVPAWKSTAVNLSDALKEGERGSGKDYSVTSCAAFWWDPNLRWQCVAGRGGTDDPHLSRASARRSGI